MLKSWMGIADHAKKAENSYNLAESYFLKSQKAIKVYLKGPEAIWRQKTTENRSKMQKALAVGRYCSDLEASNSKAKIWRLWKSHWLKEEKFSYVLMLKLFLWLKDFGNSDQLKTFFLKKLSVFFHSVSWSVHSTHEHSISLECIVNSEIIKNFTKFLNCDGSKLAEYLKKLQIPEFLVNILKFEWCL